jgi:hypothetical protein
MHVQTQIYLATLHTVLPIKYMPAGSVAPYTLIQLRFCYINATAVKSSVGSSHRVMGITKASLFCSLTKMLDWCFHCVLRWVLFFLYHRGDFRRTLGIALFWGFKSEVFFTALIRIVPTLCVSLQHVFLILQHGCHFKSNRSTECRESAILQYTCSKVLQITECFDVMSENNFTF